MKYGIIALVFLLAQGCASKEERICLDWKTTTVIKEKCIPMYGALICADEPVIKNTCILYEEIQEVVL